METILKMLSKKLFVFVFTAALVGINNKFGLGIDDATITHIVQLAVAYLFGQSVIDTVKVIKAPKPLELPCPAPPVDTPQGDGTFSSPTTGAIQ